MKLYNLLKSPRIVNDLIPDPFDERDYSDLELRSSPNMDENSWKIGYDAEKQYGKLKVKDQHTSLSCVGFGFASYVEMIQQAENKTYREFSPLSIYPMFRLPDGGAFSREAAKLICEKGICLESVYPTPHNPTEAQMTHRTNWQRDLDMISLVYRQKSYVRIAKTMDWIASAIKQYKGVACGFLITSNGWRHENLRPPLPGEKISGHLVYLTAYGQDNQGKFIQGLNSWGTLRHNQGRFKLREDYFADNGKWIINPWALTCLPDDWLLKEKTIEKPKVQFLRDLRWGMRNDQDVKNLQRALAYLGMFPKKQEHTGNYFGITFAGVQMFQLAYRIVNATQKEFGHCGLLTRIKLNEIFK